MAKKNDKSSKALISVNHTVAENRRARFDYFLEEKVEAGIMLTGTEVKSLRHGQCSLNESFAEEKNGDLWLLGSYIAPYGPAGEHLQHVPRRDRKLLLHKRELARLFAAVKQKGYTIVPVRLYFNARGVAKVEIALAKGKAQHDKRETIKERDWNRSKSRILRGGE
ncbi:MAG TPA: SsrA-binding protein SmpB [Alphaproteobacteria bacterium]|nr:SsrA-binding protein SmpB [Alphaproteobacteria bacterium]HNS44150.1 SsrA-binding protein SmpB [Alphaproteobacteria bacterium]